MDNVVDDIEPMTAIGKIGFGAGVLVGAFLTCAPPVDRWLHNSETALACDDFRDLLQQSPREGSELLEAWRQADEEVVFNVRALNAQDVFSSEGQKPLKVNITYVFNAALYNEDLSTIMRYIPGFERMGYGTCEAEFEATINPRAFEIGGLGKS